MTRSALMTILFFLLAGCAMLSAQSTPSGANPGSFAGLPFNNPSLSLDIRISDLLARLTFEEKVGMLLYDSPAIPRLGIPAYNWWSECLHGVARNGRATVFPQAIGLAATFDTALVREVASSISDEARAKFNAAVSRGIRARYAGLSFWTPNINIFRDPRWGRGQETYGEDPFLTGQTGLAFVRGLQGNDPKYLKAAACAKHFAVHSGPEPDRHKFNAVVDNKDLRETYLPAFKTLVDGGVEGVMCAYNRVNGEPCCGSSLLLTDILGNEWQFRGYIVTDCWALDDIWERHQVVPTPEEAAAMALKAGVNVECGTTFKNLPAAYNTGLVTNEDMDNRLSGLLRTRFRLGLFDPDSLIPWSELDSAVINSEDHKALARRTAAESIVLVKNKGNILPLKKDIASLFITGPLAADVSVLLGNYNGISGNLVTPLEGIMGKVSNATRVEYVKGTDLLKPIYDGWFLASSSDATIVVAGISPLLEGEEGDAMLSESNGDRKSIGLPENQVEYLRRLRGTHSKPVILVVMGGSAVSLTGVEDLADAILYAWYPGEQGGNAIADVIFGDAVPSGRLPVTIYRSVDDLPLFYDYGMKGRTYRYYAGKAEFPFGFGLSYAEFDYKDLRVQESGTGNASVIRISFTLKNSGRVAAGEVPQVYVRKERRSERDPLKMLKGFTHVRLAPGQSRQIEMTVPVADLRGWNLLKNNWELEEGGYDILVGASSEDIRLKETVRLKP
jgi:beta-glucosidase